MDNKKLNKELVQADFSDSAYPLVLEHLSATGGGIASGLCNMDSGQVLVHGEANPEVLASGDSIRAVSRALFSDAELEAADREATAELLAAAGTMHSCALSRHTILFRETETVLVHRLGDSERGVLISVSNTLPVATGLALSHKAGASVNAASPGECLAAMPDVLAGAGLDFESREFLATYGRQDEASRVRLDAGVANATAELLSGQIGAEGTSLSGQVVSGLGRVTRCLLMTDQYQICLSRVPMALDHVLYVVAPASANPETLLHAVHEAQNDVLRKIIEQILASGLQTMIVPFPRTETEFLRIVEQLRELDEDDLVGRLDIGGFVDHEFGEGEDLQRCQECIYYLPRKKWCDIPELPVPVEGHWWCRLWKM